MIVLTWFVRINYLVVSKEDAIHCGMRLPVIGDRSGRPLSTLETVWVEPPAIIGNDNEAIVANPKGFVKQPR